jgi:hypothetical protein
MSPNGKWYGFWDGGGAFGVKQDQEYRIAATISFMKKQGQLQQNLRQSALVLTTQKFEDFKLSRCQDRPRASYAATLNLTTALINLR